MKEKWSLTGNDSSVDSRCSGSVAMEVPGQRVPEAATRLETLEKEKNSSTAAVLKYW